MKETQMMPALNGSSCLLDSTDDIAYAKEAVANGKNNNVLTSDHNHVQHRKTAHNDASHHQPETQGPTESGELLESLPTRQDLFLDPANICTLIGATLSTLAMAAMWKKE